ncbi:MAG: transmembrane 220 family protein [Bacteroidota bacterium]
MNSKILSAILSFLFGLFAYYQFNDPDPILWVTIYGSVFLVSFLRLIDVYYSRRVVLILMALLIIYSTVYIPSVLEYLTQPNKNELFGAMYKSKPYIEESREFFGLVIAVIGLILHLRVKK